MQVLCPSASFSQFCLKCLSALGSFISLINNEKNINPTAMKYMFVGYQSSQKGYKCYLP